MHEHTDTYWGWACTGCGSLILAGGNFPGEGPMQSVPVFDTKAQAEVAALGVRDEEGEHPNVVEVKIAYLRPTH